MCGICGIINNEEGVPPSTTLIKKMIGALNHRGPDSCGYYRDKTVALGHSRLAIIDLEFGAQPLTNEDETLWITFNGEIFNYIELRDMLIAKGHVFKTKSDTETIIHAWEEWGTDCFNKLNGQWALAIWDCKREELILSRDRHGIRPLYYTNQKKRFLFGSEIKAIYCDETVNRAFDPKGMVEIFTYWSTIAPQTAYEGVCEIQPGHYGILNKGRLITKPYWSVTFNRMGEKSEEEYVGELENKLIEACRLRFTRSDVPVGAYLSGGIDSSITSALVSKYTDTKLNTFSLRFEDSEFDEGVYQAEMAQRLGTDHHNVVVSNRDIGEIFPEVIKHIERPVLRTAPAPLFLLSRLVRKSGYKVVVTGEGADEVLAGYDIFREARVRRIIANDPDSPNNIDLIRKLYPWMERSPGKTPAFARAFFSSRLDTADPFISHRPRWGTASGMINMFNKEFINYENSEDRINTLLNILPSDFNDWDDLERDQWIEYTTLLSGYILSAQGDRMLMGNSVEGRFPFLDPHLVDFSNNLPPHMKLKDLTEKYILKKAFADIIPGSILNRPKQPYRSPDAQSFFFNAGKLDWLDEITSEAVIKEAGIFNYQSVSKIFEKCRRNSNRKMSNSDNMRVVGIISSMLNYSNMIKGEGLRDFSFPEPSHIIDRVKQ